MIKAIRVEIIKPFGESLTWKVLGEKLNDTRYASTKIANFVIQKWMNWDFFRKQYKNEHGVFPDAKEYKEMWYCYPECVKMFPGISSSVVNQTRQQAEKIYKSSRTDIMRLQKSVPSFKLGFPICVQNIGYKIHEVITDKTHPTFVISASLGSKDSEVSRVDFIVKNNNYSAKTALKRIISGEYKQGAMQIVKDKRGKWYCIIPYNFTAKTIEVEPTRTMGVYFGRMNAIGFAFNDIKKYGYISGTEVGQFRAQVRRRRKDLQEQGKYCGEGRIGHGIKRRLLPTEKLSDLEKNFTTTTNHRWAKHIVKNAVSNKCSLINICRPCANTNELFLGRWAYFDLITKLQAKAAEVGITVNVIEKTIEHTKEQTGYVCVDCGKIYNDNNKEHCDDCGGQKKHVLAIEDYNAARAIAAEEQ